MVPSSYVHDKWRERTKKVIMNYMLVSPAPLRIHRDSHIHAVCIQSHYFPFTFTLEIVVMANCARNISLHSRTIHFFSLHCEKKSSCVPWNIEKKKLYKILSESRDNSVFRNDNSRVYTMSTMHLERF